MRQHSGRINVAIADDHLMFREGLCDILSNKFDRIYIEIQACNGRDLIDKISSKDKPPDICILDVEMPGLNGMETLLEISKKWPFVRFLVLSLYDSEFTILKMLQYGANGYLTKTCSLMEVYKAILDIHELGYYHSDIVSNTLMNYLKEDANLKPVIDISKREIEFLSYCSTDLTYKEIAKIMNVSLRTVEGYHEMLSSKLKIHSRVGLAIVSISSGIHKRTLAA